MRALRLPYSLVAVTHTNPPTPYPAHSTSHYTLPRPVCTLAFPPYPRQVGIAFSRFQMRHFSARYGQLERATLSYGPCQTPTLGFVVRRHLEVAAFRSAPFWRLVLALRLGGAAEAAAGAAAEAAAEAVWRSQTV